LSQQGPKWQRTQCMSRRHAHNNAQPLSMPTSVSTGLNHSRHNVPCPEASLHKGCFPTRFDPAVRTLYPDTPPRPVRVVHKVATRVLTASVQLQTARTNTESAAHSLLWPCHFLQNAARPSRPKAHKPAPTTRTSGPRSPEQAASPLGHKLASLATSKSSMFFSRNSS